MIIIVSRKVSEKALQSISFHALGLLTKYLVDLFDKTNLGLEDPEPFPPQTPNMRHPPQPNSSLRIPIFSIILFDGLSIRLPGAPELV